MVLVILSTICAILLTITSFIYFVQGSMISEFLYWIYGLKPLIDLIVINYKLYSPFLAVGVAVGYIKDWRYLLAIGVLFLIFVLTFA